MSYEPSCSYFVMCDFWWSYRGNWSWSLWQWKQDWVGVIINKSDCMDLKSFRQFIFNWFWMAFTHDINILFANSNKRNTGKSIHSDDSGNETRQEKLAVKIFGNIAWTASILPHCRVSGTFFLVLMKNKATQLKYIQKASALAFRNSDLDFGPDFGQFRRKTS